MENKIKKVYYEYFRIPQLIYPLLKHSGEPKEKWLLRYVKTNKTFEPGPCGGITVATLELENGRQFRGFAVCSMKDNFNYKIGRKLAVERAINLYTTCFKTDPEFLDPRCNPLLSS